MKNIKVSNLVKSLRKKMGLTQEQFAQKMGVTFSSVNNWENGKRKPQPFLYKRIIELARENGIE